MHAQPNLSIPAVLAIVVLLCSEKAHTVTAERPAYDATAKSGHIEELVVTARRREERLQDVPISATVYTDALIRDLAIRDLSELQQQAPNLQIAPFPAVNADASVSIRGQSQFEPVITLDPAVGIYIDGVYLGRSTGALLNLLDLERVEVLLGPQGTLYGRNTTGGVIHLVSKRNSSGRFGGELQLVAGNVGRHDYNLAVDFPVAGTAISGRASYQSANRDGYGRNALLGEDLDDERVDSWRLSFDWSPHPALSLFLSADSTRLRERTALFRINSLDEDIQDPGCLAEATPRFGCFVNFAITGGAWATALQGGDRTVRSDVSSTHDLDVSGVSLTVTADVLGATFKSISAYRDLERRNVNDIDGTEWAILHPDAEADQRQFSQEFQLLGESYDRSLEWIAGVYLFDESGNDNTRIVSVPALNPFSPSTILPRGENESIAAFGHVAYRISDTLNVIAGARHTRERRLLSEQQFNASGCTLEFVNRPPCRTEVADRFDGWSYVAGLDYRRDPASLVYAKVSRGFKSGGFNARASKEIEFRPVQPEIVTSFEIGTKISRLDGRLKAEAAYFYDDFRDIQRAGLVALSQTEIASTVENAASAYVTGGELRLTASFTDALQWHLGIGSTLARYREFDGADALGRPVDKSALDFPKTPRWSWNTRLRYEASLPAASDLLLQASYSWQSQTHPDVDNAPALSQGAFGLLNLRSSLTLPRYNVTVALSAKNVLDTTYVTDGLDLSGQFGYTGVFFGPPRTYTGEIYWRFGDD